MEGRPFFEYSAEPVLRRPKQFFKLMFRDAKGCGHLVMRLLQRNFASQYRQFALGLLWLVLPGVISAFVLLFSQSGSLVTDRSFAVQTFLGTLTWQTFVEAVYSPFRQIMGATSLLKNVNFPREALLWASFLEVLTTFLIRVGLMVLALVVLGGPITFQSTAGLLSGAVLVLFGLTLGLAIIPIGMLFRDVERGLAIVMTALFFLTPTVYKTQPNATLNSWIQTNPISILYYTLSDSLIFGRATHVSEVLWIGTASLAALMVAWVLCRIALPHCLQRVSV
ncbi:MAG: ABC transporter permease [Deltaproteobacteria bacterium]|nr:ABC transporter permease [Deltaproteobacteria bacterium]MBI3293554.1 ABC transporter permease [Deltaproteobacteria bacterium]